MPTLEEERAKLFGTLEELRGFYGRPPGADLMSLLMSQAKGERVPFSPDVINNQLAQNAGSGAAANRASQEAINRNFANRGLSGSGMELSALLGQQSKLSAATRAGRRDITTRAELENYYAQERAQASAQAFLKQQAELESASRLAEAGYRSQFHETSSGPKAPQGGAVPARPTQFGLTNRTLMAPMPSATMLHNQASPQQFGIVAGDYGRVQAEQSRFAQQQATYEQQLNTQIMDRAQLAAMQADWDARYGGG